MNNNEKDRSVCKSCYNKKKDKKKRKNNNHTLIQKNTASEEQPKIENADNYKN